jgi:hypothetical protein
LKLNRAMVLAAAMAAIVLAGCGSDASGVKPSSYVHAVCTSLGIWRTGVQDASNRLQTNATSVTSLQQLKQHYRTFVSALLSNTDRATSELTAAGVPAVDNGKQISSSLVQAFSTASTGLARARSQASQLPTDSPSGFKTAAGAATQTITQSLRSMKSVSPKKDPALHEASNKDPACKALKAA